MAVERITASLARAQRVLLVLAVVFTALGAASVAVGGLTLSAMDETTAAEADLRRSRAAFESTTPEEVAQTIRGRAPFRTMRVRAAKVVDELSAFVVRGISTRGERQRAYVMDTKMKRLVIKSVGDQLGSYEVVDINDEGVTLQRGNERVILSKG